ncbi:MAG: cation:proton antiporter [Rhodobiaceae bacterium]|nr:monovalent cation:proton antiporter-2 (CPA2) family protein [Rhodobiaceae bacterium]MCC0054850.1 cation:proton antiporter [Rhodobiaceae bacterium]
MAGEAPGLLVETVSLLGAAVVAAPLLRKLGIGTVLAYLAAGIAIGPWGLRMFSDAEVILHFAEFGVVLLLFVIGLELRPPRLWAMRHDIFLNGTAQLLITGAIFFAIILAATDQAISTAAMIGLSLALSSTAFGLRILEERHELDEPYGRKSFAILLLQDLAIVPLLALAALLAPYGSDMELAPLDIALMAGAVIGLTIAGRFLLNPLFRVIAQTGARELLTAAALLIVAGSALLMQLVGLSMAMGAFLAGVLLADSSYRHQLEADIEPFRGLLLGLFFMAVGMSIDLGVIWEEWITVLVAVVAVVVVKSIVIFATLRLRGSSASDALRAAGTLSQVGEFSFVMVTAMRGFAMIDYRQAAVLTAVIGLTMAATPLTRLAADRAARRFRPVGQETPDENFDDAEGRILLIGFGRFGQLSAQPLLAHGCSVTIVDNNPERIKAAADFGFKVYYGDMTRLGVLRAAGAERADIIAICPDGKATIDRIVELCKKHFPTAKLYVRAIDRDHAVTLRRLNADFIIRELAESAFAYGEAILAGLGVSASEIEDVISESRRRDSERLALQEAGGMNAGIELLPTHEAAAKGKSAKTGTSKKRRKAKAGTEK